MYEPKKFWISMDDSSNHDMISTFQRPDKSYSSSIQKLSFVEIAIISSKNSATLVLSVLFAL